MSGNSQANPESILIVRLGAMGDVLHAMPAVAALRKSLPKSRIGWVIEQRWSELLLSQSDGATAMAGGGSLLDTVHRVDTRAWRKNLLSPATWREIRTATRKLRADAYEVALDLQGAIKSATLAKAAGARDIVGFARPRESAARLWYTRQAEATAAHVIDQNLQLISSLIHRSLAAERVELPRAPEAEAWCAEYRQKHGLAGYAILNPGSGWGAKCWPGERYAEVAKRLRSAGFKSLINYGPGEEALAHTVARASEGAAEAVSCGLAELVALTRKAALFIGGDTGPMHLAAALSIPTVALFGPTDPARNGPYWGPSAVVRSEKSVTSYRHVAESDPGLHSIGVETVVAEAAKLLGVSIG